MMLMKEGSGKYVIVDNLVPVMNTGEDIILRRKFVQNKMEDNQSEHRT